MLKKCFDNKLYLNLQSEKILERVSHFGDKLYIEFGGKIFDDYHATRVLKGFELDSKVRVLSKIKNKVEILIVINADDIQSNKSRSDLGITYESDALRLTDQFEEIGLSVNGIVITHYNHQENADVFRTKLANLGIKSYLHYNIPNYPFDVDGILSENGFGKNDYIETKRPIIVVTAPGPGSGKMATCLSQLYNDNVRGIKAGYAKYETFPIWNLTLNHPVNLAYEAATADLNDVNMIDHYHLDAYGISAVNYNRDLEVFPVLKKMFEKIYGESPYQSPTDMGVNMAGFAICDNEASYECSKQEIIRRYLDAKCNVKLGRIKQEAVDKIALIMKSLNLTLDSRKCVGAALKKAEKTNLPCVAIELNNGRIITGKKSDLFEATSAAIINAIKYYAKIADDMPLLSYAIIEPIQALKEKQLNKSSKRMYLDEVLITLAITATTNAMAQRALEQLPKLAGAQMHSSVMLHPDDINTLKKLKIDVTTETNQDTKLLQR